jgi:hypothetical protein
MSNSLLEFVRVQIQPKTSASMIEHTKAEALRKRVSDYMNLPFYLERVLIFGFLSLLDQLLYLFTFLPFRIVVAFRTYVSDLYSGQ